MRHRLAAAVSGLLLVLGAAACGSETGGSAEDAASDPITVADAWVRATEGTEDPSMTAAFMVIANHTDADVQLVGATTPVTEMVQVHEMVTADDGHMVMQEAPDGVTIRAGKEQLLLPGGYHVMLMNLSDPLAAGDEVELTLEFSDGTSIDLTAPVKEFTEEEGHYHSNSADPSESPTDDMSDMS